MLLLGSAHSTATRGICSAGLQATAKQQPSRSLTTRLTKARRRDSGWHVAVDEALEIAIIS